MFPQIIARYCRKILPVALIGGSMLMNTQAMANENAAVQKTLETGLERAMEKAAQFGNTGIVLHKGKVVAAAQKGVLFKGASEPTGPDHKWHIGSITKPITATMIGRLAAQGTLNLNATIAELLPNHRTNIDPSWHDVQLIDLLQHTSGAAANFGMDVLNDRVFANPKELSEKRFKIVLDELAKPLQRKPREKFEYSNIGYTIAGTIAAQVTETSYEDLMRQEVFEPLDIKSAGFGAPEKGNPHGHTTKLFLFTDDISPDDEISDNNPLMAPAGTLHMAIADLAKFGQMHLDAAGGSDAFLPSPVSAQLQEPSATTKDRENYASGWARFKRPATGDEMHLFHNGSNTLWYAFLLVSPESETVIALATNVGTIMRSENQFIQIADDILSELTRNTD